MHFQDNTIACIDSCSRYQGQWRLITGNSLFDRISDVLTDGLSQQRGVGVAHIPHTDLLADVGPPAVHVSGLVCLVVAALFHLKHTEKQRNTSQVSSNTQVMQLKQES